MVRTTLVGGWPLPAQYAENIRRYQRGEISALVAEQFLRAAAMVMLREQKATGVTQFTGAELFTDEHYSHLSGCLTGITPVRSESPTGSRVAFFRLSGALAAPKGLGFAAGFRRDFELDPQVTKASCPGPYTLLSFLLLADPRAFSALPQAVGIVRAEAAALAAAGAREIQLDAMGEVTALRLFGRDPLGVADVIGDCFRGVRNVTRTVHFCTRGVHATDLPPADTLRSLLPVIERLQRKVDKVHVECADQAARALIGSLPEGFEVVAGLADVTSDAEPVEVLVARAREVLHHIPAERLWVAPSCGMWPTPRARATAIVTNLVAAARRLSE